MKAMSHVHFVEPINALAKNKNNHSGRRGPIVFSAEAELEKQKELEKGKTSITKENDLRPTSLRRQQSSQRMWLFKKSFYFEQRLRI